MRAIAESFVNALPLDDRAREVLVQTLIDWRDETACATSAIDRTWRSLRSALAFYRALVGLSISEMRELPREWPTVFAILGWTSVFCAIEAGRWDMTRHGFSPWVMTQLTFWRVPSTATFVLPLGCFLGVRREAKRFLALGAAAFALMLLLMGWVVPLANQQSRIVIFQASFAQMERTPPVSVPVPTVREMTLPKLANAAGSRDAFNEPGLRQIGLRLGLIAACPTWLWLAGAVSKVRVKRWRGSIGALIGYVVLWRLAESVGPWLVPVAAMALAWMISATLARRERQSPPALPSSA